MFCLFHCTFVLVPELSGHCLWYIIAGHQHEPSDNIIFK